MTRCGRGESCGRPPVGVNRVLTPRAVSGQGEYKIRPYELEGEHEVRPYMDTHSHFSIAAAPCLLAFVVGGCGSPNQANVGLRKQIQQLQTQVNELQVQHQGDQQTIQGLRDRQGTLPTLPSARLDQLFTTHGLEFGRLTGGADLDPAKPGDEGFVIYIVPTDAAGEKLKSAGSFDIEAYDLAESTDPLLGHWHFDLAQSKETWTGALLQYNYVLTCPWQKKTPRHADVTVKVTFFDELTQTPFTAQKVIHVNVAPQTQPGPSPSPSGRGPG